MANKKDFTKADEAVNKFFEQPQNNTHDTNKANDTHVENNTNKANDTHVENNTNKANNTYDIHDTNKAKITNKSKHYNERGKRAERFGLLLDEQLKVDLKHLSMAKGSKSINDFIVTILIEYVERKENQVKIEQYRNLLKE